jgi:hypothetical protein
MLFWFETAYSAESYPNQSPVCFILGQGTTKNFSQGQRIEEEMTIRQE